MEYVGWFVIPRVTKSVTTVYLQIMLSYSALQGRKSGRGMSGASTDERSKYGYYFSQYAMTLAKFPETSFLLLL
jgi:hypothetical protein